MVSHSPAVHRSSPEAPPSSDRWRYDLRAFGATAAVSLAAAVAITTILSTREIYSAAVRDPISVALEGDALPFFTGWATFLGAVGWFSSGAFALMAWKLRRGRGGERWTSAMLLSFAGLSALLGTDDLFMLHDGFPQRLGIPEEVTTGVMVLLAATWGLTFARRILFDVDALILVLAAACFAHSVVSDVLSDLNGPAVLLHEESTKFAAIICWTVWAWRRSVRAASESSSAVDGPLT